MLPAAVHRARPPDLRSRPPTTSPAPPEHAPMRGLGIRGPPPCHRKSSPPSRALTHGRRGLRQPHAREQQREGVAAAVAPAVARPARVRQGEERPGSGTLPRGTRACTRQDIRDFLHGWMMRVCMHACTHHASSSSSLSEGLLACMQANPCVVREAWPIHLWTSLTSTVPSATK